jgi:hypothetical protein
MKVKPAKTAQAAGTTTEVDGLDRERGSYELTWRRAVRSMGRELEVLEISNYVTLYRCVEKV